MLSPKCNVSTNSKQTLCMRSTDWKSSSNPNIKKASKHTCTISHWAAKRLHKMINIKCPIDVAVFDFYSKGKASIFHVVVVDASCSINNAVCRRWMRCFHPNWCICSALVLVYLFLGHFSTDLVYKAIPSRFEFRVTNHWIHSISCHIASASKRII